MNCVVIPNHDAKFVEVRGVIYCNGAYGTDEILRNVVPQMLVRGTEKHDRSAFAGMLDDYSLQYSINTSSLSPLFIGFSARSLLKYLTNLLEIIQESLSSPTFEEGELEIEKGQYRALILNREFNPAFRAGNEGPRLLYGPGHLLYQSPQDVLLTQLESLTSEDLRKAWGLIDVPKNLGLVIVGDVDFSHDSQFLDKLFSWDQHTETLEKIDANTFTEFEMDRGREERTLFIPDKSNATVWLGERLPITSTDERYPALLIANSILGTSMSSRLFRYVREELGLSYGVRSTLVNMRRIPGYLEITASTNFKKVEQTQEAILHVLEVLVSSGVTQKELDRARAMLRGSTAVAASSYGGIAKQEVVNVVTGVKNFHSVLEEKIAILTVGDVNEAIAEFIHPDKMKIVRAGTIE